MMLDAFGQDVRVGFRVLLKDKGFLFLAVLVLALGIGAATTQFTVVNAIVLRGFSFPHPEELMSVGLIDPKASDQVNNFGNGQIPTAQDYEDLKAGQKSFVLMAGYLSGSTINVTTRTRRSATPAATSRKICSRSLASRRSWAGISPPRTTNLAPRKR